MTFAEKFIELHKRHYSTLHALSSSAIAFLCLMSAKPSTYWRPGDFQDEFGLSYIACSNTIKRLRLEGFVDSDNRITAIGLTAVGVPRPE